MKFKHLNIKNVKELINKKEVKTLESPERRGFIKTMGLGIIAANPILSSANSFANTDFKLNYQSDALVITRNKKIVWEINSQLFGDSIAIHVVEHSDKFHISAKNLQIKYSDISFDLNVALSKTISGWDMNFSIPQFSLHEDVDFIDWLDGYSAVVSNANINKAKIKLNTTDHIQIKGDYSCQISSDWEMIFNKTSGISLALNNTNYSADELVVTRDQQELNSLLDTKLSNTLRFSVKGENNWKKLVQQIEIENKATNLNTNDNPAINFSIGKKEDGSLLKALWVSKQNGQLNLSHHALSDADLLFNTYFYFSDYSSHETPSFYLSAKMANHAQKFSNAVGSFTLKPDSNDAELEFLGKGIQVKEAKIEPLFSGFQPIVMGALSLPVDQKEEKISLAHLSKSKGDKASLSSEEQKLEFSSKKPIKIKVLRPEDMVYLEFEFYNFKFVNKNGKSPISTGLITKPKTIIERKNPRIIKKKGLKNPPKKGLKKGRKGITKPLVRPLNHNITGITKVPSSDFKTIVNFSMAEYSSLELENPREKGTVIIYFPTQHTLEEAFYEANPNFDDTDATGSYKIPIRHIRANRSRLVYELEAGHKGFPLSMTELLDWSKFKLKVDGRAYIDLNDFNIINKPTYSFGGIIDRNKVNFHTNKDIKYGFKLKNKTVLGNQKLNLYKEKELNKILLTSTLKPSFNKTRMIADFSFKVKEISGMYTSIEAPALLYISPNQINDFHHRKEIDQVNVYKESISKGFAKVKPIKTLTEIRRKPLTKIEARNIILPASSQTGVITELWHTHLGVKLKNGQTSPDLDKLKTIRALWAFDADSDYSKQQQRNKPFRASLDANNRHKLVHLTSNFGINNYKPQPVPVKKLILSNLGAYLDWKAHFNIPNAAKELNIVDWEHQATLGRDHYVKVVEQGYLFPFGHRAALVKVTERKFDSKTKAAINKQFMYVVVLQESVSYNRNDANNQFIKFPFTAIKLRIEQTPNIDKPMQSNLYDDGVHYNFLIKTGGKALLFDLFMTDKEGEEHYFKMPLTFVENGVAFDSRFLSKVISNYHKPTYDDYTIITSSGQEIAYSEAFVGGDTSLETESIQFGAMAYPNRSGAILFHPIMRSSEVHIDAIEKMTQVRKPTKITLEDDNNSGHIFARVADTIVDFTNSSGVSGGFLTPNMPVDALSKIHGAVGGAIEDLKNSVFDPSSIFDELDDLPVAKIFGAIKLLDLFTDLNLTSTINSLVQAVERIKNQIDEIKNSLLLYENELQQEIEEAEQKIYEIEQKIEDTQAEIEAKIQEVEDEVQSRIDEVEQKIEDTKKQLKHQLGQLIAKLNESIPSIPNLKTFFTDSAYIAQYRYQPEFKSKEIEIISGLLKIDVADKKSGLKIVTTMTKPYSLEEEASVKSYARFDKFAIDIVPMLKVKFNYLEYTSSTTSKTDVKVDMDADNAIEFKGALSFVNNLQSIIPSGGFSEDGPYIDLQPLSVKAGFNMSVPNVEVGALMLTNISLGAFVKLPFTGAPLTLGFNFCTRENPFLLTISGFGGGGYFMIVTTLDGIQSLEAAFEFGAAMSLNLGVASGSVTVMGGFYFKMELIEDDDGEEVSEIALSGYLRMNGRLSVLGLIHASLEFYLALNAIIVDGKVEKMEGTASVRVRVEVLFFSKTVTVNVRRELKGADADPKFIEMVDDEDWLEYCSAFAS